MRACIPPLLSLRLLLSPLCPFLPLLHWLPPREAIHTRAGDSPVARKGGLGCPWARGTDPAVIHADCISSALFAPLSSLSVSPSPPRPHLPTLPCMCVRGLGSGRRSASGREGRGERWRKESSRISGQRKGPNFFGVVLVRSRSPAGLRRELCCASP